MKLLKIFLAALTWFPTLPNGLIFVIPNNGQIHFCNKRSLSKLYFESKIWLQMMTFNVPPPSLLHSPTSVMSNGNLKKHSRKKLFVFVHRELLKNVELLNTDPLEVVKDHLKVRKYVNDPSALRARTTADRYYRTSLKELHVWVSLCGWEEKWQEFLWMQAVWPDLAKFRHFGKNLKIFDKYLTVNFLFGKMLSLLWQIFDIIGLVFMVKYLKII